MKVELALRRPSATCASTCFVAWPTGRFFGPYFQPRLAWFSFRNYGFSDGADLFVFISGYTSALVYTRKMREHGFVFGATRLFRRVWQIYVAHVLLFVAYLTSVHFLSDRFDAPDFIDLFNVAPLLSAPVETLTQGLCCDTSR